MIPQPIIDLFAQLFIETNHEIDVQVGTMAASSPHVRTMRLYEVTPEGHFILMSRTDTQKWADLEVNPFVSLCYYSDKVGQIIIEGRADLKTIKTSPQEIIKFWSSLLPRTKQIYTKGDTIPDFFGLIEVFPTMIEWMEIDPNNYLLSNRQRYVRGTNQEWNSIRLQPI